MFFLQQKVLRSSSPRPPESGDQPNTSPKRPRLSLDAQSIDPPSTPNDDNSRLSGNDSDSEMIPVKQEMIELKDCTGDLDGAEADSLIAEAYLKEATSTSNVNSQQTSNFQQPPNAPPPPGPLLPSYVPPPQVKPQDGKFFYNLVLILDYLS